MNDALITIQLDYKIDNFSSCLFSSNWVMDCFFLQRSYWTLKYLIDSYTWYYIHIAELKIIYVDYTLKNMLYSLNEKLKEVSMN